MVQWPGNKKARKIRVYSSPKLEPFDSHFGASLRAPFDARDPSASLGINKAGKALGRKLSPRVEWWS